MIDDEALKAIENLHRLKGEGIITEEEFEASKQKILFGTSPRRAAATPSLVSFATSFTGELPQDDDHLGWATLALKRFADFTGRSSRKEFWMFQLLLLCSAIAAFVIAAAIAQSDTSGSLGELTLGLIVLAYVVLIVPQLAAEVRRFHDQDRSGWFALLNLVPYVGPVIVLVFMLMEGTPGDNRFGADPKIALP